MRHARFYRALIIEHNLIARCYGKLNFTYGIVTGVLDALICGGVGILLWLSELKVEQSRVWTKQKMFEEVKRLRHLICQHQHWWLRIALKMQEPGSPREIAAVNIRTLPSPGSRDQPGRWACKCSHWWAPRPKTRWPAQHIPDICHERHEYIRVNVFWPV